ncbi:hypothetical protein QGM71_15530 [Virgibacillus sp. C22-A2]|uniref:DksA C4-type domain-containing protein n=1 Tax=Virgibacillus tibetensis TaxID=3042313 RepID=A0ABU6KHW6_9BACI|nr:hypothetical protein [Virgibacillus sp. C22-A2]
MSNHLSQEEIKDFKEQLLKLKKENLEAMESSQGTGPNESIAELADYDNHPADMGTEQFEQQRDQGLNLIRKDRLQEINDALQRIEDGTYGLSEKSGEPIPVERLKAQPMARNLVEEE